MKKLLVLLFCFVMACGTDPAQTTVVNNSADTGVNNTDDTGTTDTSDPDVGDPDMNNEVSCRSADDCPPPQICALDLIAGLICKDPGGKMNGEMCVDGSECESGICLNGACADPCQSEQDCPAGYECSSQQVPTDNGPITIDVCVEEPTPCLANPDCMNGEVCVVDLTMGAVLSCDDPVGPGMIGDACTMDAQCQSNLCVNDICTAPCERPNDCSLDGSFICEPTMVATGNGGQANLNLCAPRPATVCLSDNDCTAPERCVATRSATDVEFACGAANANGGETGASCNVDGDCSQNLCVGGLCAGPCQGNGDCSGAQDFTCELVMVDLGGGNSDSAQVCAPPVVCDESDDCRVNETCYIRNNAGNVDLLCLSPNVGGGSLNQVCSGNLECADNLCLATRFRDVCTNACADNSDCTETGYSCQSVDVAGTAIDVCAPVAPAACMSNDDCAGGTTCSVIVNVAGNGLESACVPSTGGDASGVACTNDDDCSSLLCENNECSAPCADSNDCPAGQLCTNQSVTKDGQTTSLNLCTTPPDIECASSDDCTDGVRVCGDLRLVQGDLTPFCGFPNVGGGQLGTACTIDTQCRENVCLTGIANECSVVCDENADCGAGQGCTTYSDIGFCNTTCTDSGDCGNNTFCTINGDTIANDIDQVCQVPPGAKLLGDTCASGNECQTGLCLTTFLFTGVSCTSVAQCNANETCECPVDQPNCTIGKECATTTNACTNLCDENSDCLGGAVGNVLTECSANTVVPLPNGMGTKTIATCAQP